MNPNQRNHPPSATSSEPGFNYIAADCGGLLTIFLQFNSLAWSGAATIVGCGQIPLSKKMGIKQWW